MFFTPHFLTFKVYIHAYTHTNIYIIYPPTHTHICGIRFETLINIKSIFLMTLSHMSQSQTCYLAEKVLEHMIFFPLFQNC